MTPAPAERLAHARGLYHAARQVHDALRRNRDTRPEDLAAARARLDTRRGELAECERDAAPPPG